MTKAREMLELADEFEGEAKAHRAMGDKAEATKCLRAAYALRRAAQADAPAILPQQMRDALVSYRFAQKWATGTEEHRLAIQVADAINPLPPWYEIETPSHTRPELSPTEKIEGQS